MTHIHPGPATPLTGQEAVAYVERRLTFPRDVLGRFPKYFLIETINSCNTRCVMCGIDFDKKAKAVMSDALFEKIAAEIGAHHDHVEKVMLDLDGEPLLDRFPAAVHAALDDLRAALAPAYAAPSR